MRFAATFVVLVFTSGALTAQPCDPSQSTEACADTTNWHRYLPLAVGNVWQYAVDRFIQPDYVHGTRILRTAEIDGETYFLAERCLKTVSETLTCEEPVPIRYDEGSRAVVRRIDTPGEEAEFALFHPSEYQPFCPLNASFAESGTLGCEVAEGSGRVEGAYGVGYEGLGDTRKTFDDGLQGSVTYVAGIGPVGSENVDNEIVETLAYAHVGGAEVGTTAFAFPTSSEPEGIPAARTAFTALFPNPARDAVWVRYRLGTPQAVTLELIDVLGRRVRAAEVGPQSAAADDVQIDLDGLRAGLYVLRLRGDAGAETARRFVVVR